MSANYRCDWHCTSFIRIMTAVMEKYLAQYAEPEITALADLLDAMPGQEPWANVMVVPACNESADFLRPPPACDGRSLLILVINESESVSAHVSERNQALAKSVQASFVKLSESDPNIQEFSMGIYCDRNAPRDVLLVDRFSTGRKLPLKGGVGHARKIGVDLAASLIHSKRIRSNWIHCTDADVLLPDVYFTCSQAAENSALDTAALVYPFHHRDEQGISASIDVILATQLYELSLRYYLAGMKFAQSPYAFHTIGSTMAVSARHYAMVRGFPRREAGEDFYLLNKLAKVGAVINPGVTVDCAPLVIEARKSDRVPFGTGAAVIKITDMADPVADFRYYDPAVFELLKLWLRSLPGIWNSGSTEPQDLPELLLSALKKIKTEQALAHAFKQSKDLQQFTRQMHTWFDAFRTLKLIHHFRDDGLQSISYSRLVSHPVYEELLNTDAELQTFHKQLQQKLEEV